MKFNSGTASLTIVIMALVLGACRKSGDNSSNHQASEMHALTAEELKGVAGRELILSAPEVCMAAGQQENDENAEQVEFSQPCEKWLGQRDDGIGLTHYQQRLGFSIEEVDTNGRFRIAVYPDCKQDQRLAEESKNYPEPNDAEYDAPDPYTEVKTGLENVVEGEEGKDPDPLLDNASLEVVATTKEQDVDHIALENELSKSPYAECRQLITTGANSGAQVEVVDPASVGDKGWWRILVKEGERPVFVNTDDCSGDDCPRLFLGEQNTLISVNQSEVQFGLKSIFKRISGAVSKTWNSGVQTVADAAKSIGTSTNISKLGNKKLYISAATPAAKLYDAAKEQGPQALSLANGVAKDGAVYAQIGAKYVEKAGNAVLDGVVYIAEYIQANACFLGVATGLGTVVAKEAANHEAVLQLLALDYADDLKSKSSFDALMAKKGDFYNKIDLAATAISLPTALVSQRYSVNEWRSIVMDIIGSALTGKVKFGFVGIIISKLSKAICLGVDQAASPEDASKSTIHANGLSDECLNTLKDHAHNWAKNGWDICHALKVEIRNHAAAAPASDKLTNAWETVGATGSCPKDPEAEAYLALLEGWGCKEERVYTDDEARVDPFVVLNRNQTWTRTNDWFATLKCAKGDVAVGFCSSGAHPDCYSMTKEMLCANLPDGRRIVDYWVHVDKIGNTDNSGMEICPNGYAVTEFCSSGYNKDCDGNSMKMRCARIKSGLEIDYGNCTVKETKSWEARLQATAPNDVVIGACTSGRYPDCGQNREYTKSALFCPVVPATTDKTTHTLFRYTRGDDSFFTRYLGENPYRYDFDGTIQVYSKNATGRQALMRCLKGTDHYNAIGSCGADKNEGLLGYTSMTNQGGRHIVRCVKNGRHMTAADSAECLERGYSVSGDLGYEP